MTLNRCSVLTPIIPLHSIERHGRHVVLQEQITSNMLEDAETSRGHYSLLGGDRGLIVILAFAEEGQGECGLGGRSSLNSLDSPVGMGCKILRSRTGISDIDCISCGKKGNTFKETLRKQRMQIHTWPGHSPMDLGFWEVWV